MNPEMRAALNELIRDYHVRADQGFQDAVEKAIDKLASEGSKGKAFWFSWVKRR